MGPTTRNSLLAAVLAGAGFVVVARYFPDVRPEGDMALTDIQVISGLRGWQPLGAYSRANGNHPGPFYFFLLSPLYLLSGYRHVAIVITAAILNVASVVGTAEVLRRYGNGRLLVAATLCLTVFLIRMNGLLASPWNPHVGLMPLLFLAVACAALAARRAHSLVPFAVVAATLAIQAHFAFAVPALAIGATTLAFAIARIPRHAHAQPPQGTRRPWLIGGALAVILWAPPLIDEVRPGGDHNLRRVASFLATEPTGDVRQASRAFEQLFVAPVTPGLQLWGTPISRQASGARTVFHVQCALLIVAALVAYRRRCHLEVCLAAIAVCSGLVAWLTIRSAPGSLETHTILWITIFGLISWTVIVSAILGLLPIAWTRLVTVRVTALRTWFALSLIAIIVASAASVRTKVRQDVAASSVTMGVSEIVEAHIRSQAYQRPYIVVRNEDWGLAAGVVLQLYRQGITPMITPSRLGMFGKQFTPQEPKPPQLTFANQEEDSDDYRHRVNYMRIGRSRGVSVYEVDSPPATTLVEEVIAITDRSEEVTNAGAAVNQHFDASETDRSYLPTTAAYITVRAPPGRLVGVRLWAEPNSSWQIRCSKSTAPFERIGRIIVPDGPSPQVGEAYLRGLDECGEVKIAPVHPVRNAWLTEIQLLRLSSIGLR